MDTFEICILTVMLKELSIKHLVTLFVRKVLEQTVMEEKHSLFLHTPS